MSPIYYSTIKKLNLSPCESEPAAAVQYINLTTALIIYFIDVHYE